MLLNGQGMSGVPVDVYSDDKSLLKMWLERRQKAVGAQ